MDQLALGVEDSGLPLTDVALLLGAEVLIVHATEYLNGVAKRGCCLPVAGVQALPCVGQILYGGAVVVGGGCFGKPDDEGDGGLLPGGADLVRPGLGGDVELLLGAGPTKAAEARGSALAGPRAS